MQTIPKGVTVKETVFREVSAVTESWGWARLLMDEATGRVNIVSDYGDWSYCWRHIGQQSLPKFLAGLDSSYMAEKMLGSNARVGSDELTVKEIRRQIVEYRKDGSIEKEQAAKEWALVKEYEDGWVDFRGWCDATDFFECPWEMRCDEPCGRWANFWNHLWSPLIVPALKELTQGNNYA